MARNDARLLTVPDPRTVGRAIGTSEQEATASKKPVFCPQCGVRVMAFDLKLNHCFRCNSLLDETREEKSTPRHDPLTLK